MPILIKYNKKEFFIKTIVFTGGGTGGHVIPNIALFDEIRKMFDRIY